MYINSKGTEKIYMTMIMLTFSGKTHLSNFGLKAKKRQNLKVQINDKGK